MVHQSEKLLAWHRFRIHDRCHDIDAHLFIGHLESLPDGCLTAATRADDHYTHPLLGRFVELLNFANLRIDMLKLQFGDGGVNSLCERLVLDVSRVYSGEHVSLQSLILNRVIVGQF